jgi:hypothetical protein
MKAMENNYSGNGNVSLAICGITGVFSWLADQSFGELLKYISMVVSIVAGLAAIRYYYYATKKQK